MPESAMTSLKTHFADLPDPRVQHSIEHLLIDIVMLTICAVVCGAESWVEIENYGLAKQELLETFLELPNGIPSHDTIERVLARLRPEALQQCFLNWVQAAFEISGGKLIAVDGKTLRGSYERGGKQGMIHMVSAWAVQNRTVLGQRKVNEKSNEITAIPELLGVLDLAGAIVSIDAMGCQTAIAQQIVEQQGDYVLALKGNQGSLFKDVVQLFDYARQQHFRGIEHDCYETQEQAHGRTEIRRYWVMGQTGYLVSAENWAKLKTIGCVESQRQVGEQTTYERRYYLLSLPLDARQFAQSVRGHWGIENQLHWILDVAFREDQVRPTQGYSGENLAVIRHLALNLLTQENSAKGGIRAKRLKAGWDDQYLLKVLAHSSSSSLQL
ncbi:ISAs1 family transposase [Leptolyngbya sp. AN03gr2]|uniref:ISAs1 family transposase n=1 Tax=unclassified Leptolyngbya TaxID=2650499 RepID=UPI003D316D08